MQEVLLVIGSVVSAYLIGSFPTSVIMARLKGVDILRVGSGNAGATNVFRSAGKLLGLITLLIDMSKGILAATLVANFFYQYTETLDYDFYRSMLGFVAVCGHIWSAFLGFKGGKGVATTLGVALALAPKAFLSSIAIWGAVFFLTKYVSLASVIMLIAFPLLASIFMYSFYVVIFSIALSALSIYKHSQNIKRLISGEESRIVAFKSKPK